MSEAIKPEVFTKALFVLLQEIFEKVSGIILDGGTSLFETISAIDSEKASQPLVPGGSTIVAHTDHIRFYLDVLEQYMDGNAPKNVDWASSWSVKSANAAEWDVIKKRLRDSHERVMKKLHSVTDWNAPNQLDSALAVLAHSSYHLGSIRQILTVVKQG